MTFCCSAPSFAKQWQMCEFLHVITINFHKKVHEHVQIPLLLPSSLHLQLLFVIDTCVVVVVCTSPVFNLFVFTLFPRMRCVFVIRIRTRKKLTGRKQLNTVQMFLLFKFLKFVLKKWYNNIYTHTHTLHIWTLLYLMFVYKNFVLCFPTFFVCFCFYFIHVFLFTRVSERSDRTYMILLITVIITIFNTK